MRSPSGASKMMLKAYQPPAVYLIQSSLRNEVALASLRCQTVDNEMVGSVGKDINYFEMTEPSRH